MEKKDGQSWNKQAPSGRLDSMNDNYASIIARISSMSTNFSFLEG